MMPRKQTIHSNVTLNAFTSAHARPVTSLITSPAEHRGPAKLGATLRTPHAPYPRAAPPGGFFADVVKNVSVPNLELKKLIYMYLVRHAGEQPDLALLSVNSFQRDLSDQNPLIRALALRVMSSIRLPIIQPIVLMAVQKCAKVGWAHLRPPHPTPAQQGKTPNPAASAEKRRGVHPNAFISTRQ